MGLAGGEGQPLNPCQPPEPLLHFPRTACTHASATPQVAGKNPVGWQSG